jgi:hypothetical protein
MHQSAQPASMARIASTPALSAPWAIAAASAARFAAAPRQLPTIFRNPMVAHALSSRLPAPARLRSLVSALRGRLAVVNPPRPTRLPGGLVTALRALIRAGCTVSAVANETGETDALHPDAGDDARPRRSRDPRLAYERRMLNALLSTLPSSVQDRLSRGATWAALALYESAMPAVWLDPSVTSDTSAASPSAVATIRLDYRLVVAAGAGTPREWDALDAAALATSAAAWPVRRRPGRSLGGEEERRESASWFGAPLLVPDPWLAAHADAETLAHWARLTGRSGAPDRYWFPETWDRFLEPGRRVGWLTAGDVWRPRRGTLASAGKSDAGDVAETDDALLFRRPELTLTPDLERGVGVPPGYALVQCAGILSVAIVLDP